MMSETGPEYCETVVKEVPQDTRVVEIEVDPAAEEVEVQQTVDEAVEATQPIGEVFEDDEEDDPGDAGAGERPPMLYATLPDKAAAAIVETVVEVTYEPVYTLRSEAPTPKAAEAEKKEDEAKDDDEAPGEEVVAVENPKDDDAPEADVAESSETPGMAADGGGEEPPRGIVLPLGGGDDESERPANELQPTPEESDSPEETSESTEEPAAQEDKGEDAPTPQPANFETISEGQPHDNARHDINAKLERKAKEELGMESVERYPVPDEKVDWRTEYDDYSPQHIDLPHNDTSFNPETNQDDPSQIESFQSLATEEVQRDEAGRPLNPMGRTGIEGRGVLAKWGPTEAADTILTRNNPEGGQLEVLLVQRKDTGEWAIPGGKRDPGEEVWETASRELIEEAGVQGIDTDFSASPVVYAGYIDDSRNTDNAWMESTALHRHLNFEESRNVTIQAGSDAAATRWVTVDDELYPTMFGSHGPILKLAVEDSSE